MQPLETKEIRGVNLKQIAAYTSIVVTVALIYFDLRNTSLKNREFMQEYRAELKEYRTELKEIQRFNDVRMREIEASQRITDVRLTVLETQLKINPLNSK